MFVVIIIAMIKNTILTEMKYPLYHFLFHTKYFIEIKKLHIKRIVEIIHFKIDRNNLFENNSCFDRFSPYIQ